MPACLRAHGQQFSAVPEESWAQRSGAEDAPAFRRPRGETIYGSLGLDLSIIAYVAGVYTGNCLTLEMDAMYDGTAW